MEIFHKELAQLSCMNVVLRLVYAFYHTAQVTAFICAFHPISYVPYCRAKQNVN